VLLWGAFTPLNVDHFEYFQVVNATHKRTGKLGTWQQYCNGYAKIIDKTKMSAFSKVWLFCGHTFPWMQRFSIARPFGSKSMLGGLKNKSELLSHFSSSFACFACTNGNYCWVQATGSAKQETPRSGVASTLSSTFVFHIFRWSVLRRTTTVLVLHVPTTLATVISFNIARELTWRVHYYSCLTCISPLKVSVSGYILYIQTYSWRVYWFYQARSQKFPYFPMYLTMASPSIHLQKLVVQLNN
jgi:hypothetical protein